jgi:hypothetical protein
MAGVCSKELLLQIRERDCVRKALRRVLFSGVVDKGE